MKRVLILAEGQTEERFVKDVLRPHFYQRSIHLEPKIVTTKRVKSGLQFKGGVTSFKKIEEDLRRLLGDSNAATVTTLLDYFRFPRDFNGWEHVTSSQPLDRVIQLERALAQHFKERHFWPYLMLHEYEAILFTNPHEIAAAFNEPQKAVELQRIRDSCSGPEKINEGESSHPSARLKQAFPGYQKALHGPLIAGRTGLSQVRAACPHFDEWMRYLESVQ